jgi:hypothetical protein
MPYLACLLSRLNIKRRAASRQRGSMNLVSYSVNSVKVFSPRRAALFGGNAGEDLN